MMFDKCRYEEKEFREAVANSSSIREALTKLGLNPTNGNYITFHRKVAALDVATSHFSPKARDNSSNPIYSLEEILVENSNYTNVGRMKKRLIEAELLTYECSKCHISEWNGERISLHLDHINGIRTDNRLENLRLLCPNCHSQTDTYAGKNLGRYCEHKIEKRPKTKEKIEKITKSKIQKLCSDCGAVVERRSRRCRSCSSYDCAKPKIEWPSVENLMKMVESSSYVAVGKELGVSDNAVRKHIQRHQMRE